MNDTDFMKQVERVYAFRSRSPIRAPGIPIGVEMVNIALEKLGDVKKLGAIAEVGACLSDSIQATTGCTVGNKYLKIYDDIGRYALVLYDRKTGRGVRVYVDLKKIDPEKMPETHKFFLRQRAPEVKTDMKLRAESAKIIFDEFLACQRDIFGWQKVMVKDYSKPEILPVKVCEVCEESYICDDEDSRLCKVCAKEQEYYSVEN
jgi:formylmethanofuran dehydrogenase subunit E